MLLMEGFGFNATFRDLCVILDEAVIFIQSLLITKEALQAYKIIDMFLQQVCSRIPDKADYRQKASDAVVSILYVLPKEPHSSFMGWFINFCYSDKSSNRHFAVEVIEKIFEKRCSSVKRLNIDSDVTRTTDSDSVDENAVESNIPPAAIMEIEHGVLICILLTRSQDITTPVRTKALSVLTDCIFKFKSTVNIMTKIFSQHEEYRKTTQAKDGFPDLKTLHSCYEKRSMLSFLILWRYLKILQYSLLDERAFVRKATLSFIENIFKLDEFWMSENNMLQTLSRHCRDPLPAVRKQTIQTLSSLLFHFSNHKNLYEIWVQNVLPQIRDPEVKVQEKVLEEFHSLLVKNISVFSHTQSDKHEIPWMLIWNILKFQMQKLLISACSTWFKSGNVSSHIIKVAQTHIGTVHNVQAWCLIQSISEVTNIRNPGFVYEYYEQKINHLKPGVTCAVVMVVDILQSCWKNLPQEIQEKFKEDIMYRVMICSLPVELISSSVDTVCLMLEEDTPENSDDTSSVTSVASSSTSVVSSSTPVVSSSNPAVSSWLNNLTEACEEHLKNKCNLSVLDDSKESYEYLLRCLLTFGNAVQNNRGNADIAFLEKLLEFFFIEKHPDTGLKGARFRKLLATAIISFGKIALVNQAFAKKLIPHLGKHVISTKDSRAKVNAMYILTDMCVRYTAAVEPYIPNMSICLKDENPLVREKTLSCFIQLLQEDYIKPRGSLFFNLLSAVCDPDENIQGIIIYFIKESWLPKSPNLMFASLPESLFYYNGYQGHEGYSCTFSSVDKNYFCMSGPENVELRRNLYRFMLEHLDEFARFKEAQKLVEEILGGVVSGKINLSEAGEALIRDTLYILSCDEMRATSKARQEEELPSTSMFEEIQVTREEKIKKVLLSEATKKNAIENIIPVLINLKVKFQKMKSPLYSDLMHYFLDLTLDYKKEVNDLFASDPNYKKQVSADLKKFEEDQKRRRKHSINIDERRNSEQNVSDQTRHKRKSVAVHEMIVGEVENMSDETSANVNSEHDDNREQERNENVVEENVHDKGKDGNVSENQSNENQNDVPDNDLNNDKSNSKEEESERSLHEVDMDKEDNKIRETGKRKKDNEIGETSIINKDDQTEDISKKRKKANMPGKTSNINEEDDEIEIGKTNREENCEGESSKNNKGKKREISKRKKGDSQVEETSHTIKKAKQIVGESKINDVGNKIETDEEDFNKKNKTDHKSKRICIKVKQNEVVEQHTGRTEESVKDCCINVENSKKRKEEASFVESEQAHFEVI